MTRETGLGGPTADSPDDRIAQGGYWEGHRIDPATNCYRWYRVWVQRDLFGVWCVGTAWGRLGTVRYQQQLHSMADVVEARAWAQSLITRKMRKGYRAQQGVAPGGLEGKPRESVVAGCP